MKTVHKRDLGEERNPFWVWVPDRRWTTDRRIVGEHRCRWGAGPGKPACGLFAEAATRRSNGWWCYCGEHLYGRRIIDGVVEVLVHRESPASRRGFAE